MAKHNKYQGIAEEDHKKAEATLLRLSFEYLDWDDGDLFFLHGLEADYYKKDFETLSEVKRSTESSILTQNHPSLVPKSIFNTPKSKRSSFPVKIIDTIETKLKAESAGLSPSESRQKAKTIVDRAFEVRVGKAYGRVHAFLWDKVFHVVWFDPAHNLYPKEDHGIRGPKEYATVKCFSPAEVEAVLAENRRVVDEQNEISAKMTALQKDYDELFELYAATSK